MPAVQPLLQETPAGLYCPQGDFYVDPWRRVDRAVITHAHADHARQGMGHYLTTTDGYRVLRRRMGSSAVIDRLDYGQSLTINSVHVSLHPAGHVLGSAQVRIEHHGQICVVSGDYKVVADPTCRTFEPVRCHTFVTECTFGLPIFRWPNAVTVTDRLNDWWRSCRETGRVAVLFAYSLGKAQRIIRAVDSSIGPIVCHNAVEELNQDYRDSGISLPATITAPQSREKATRRGNGRQSAEHVWNGALVIAPPAVAESKWLQQFGDYATATASGWMMIRGTRRWQSVDRGFVLSDHADWQGLVSAIHQSEAEQVLVTHGHTEPMVRWLQEQGLDSRSLKTRFTGDSEDSNGDDREPEPSP